MKRITFLCAILILVLGSDLSLGAQTLDTKLTLEDIYKDDSYSTRYYRTACWQEKL